MLQETTKLGALHYPGNPAIVTFVEIFCDHFKGWNGDLLSGIFTGHIESPGFRTDSPQQIGFAGK